MSFWYLLNEAVGAQHPELTADKAGSSFGFLDRRGFGIEQEPLQVAVAQTVDYELAPATASSKALSAASERAVERLAGARNDWMFIPPEDVCSLWQAKQCFDKTGLTRVSIVGGFRRRRTCT